MLLAATDAVSARESGIRIGSYNLRMQQLDKGDNDWSVRRQRVMESIRENGFDIFGVQELTDSVQDDLREDLGDKYEFLFFSPYSQDGNGSRAQGIIYDKKRFKLLEYHYFWISDTPDTMSDNDHYSDGSGRSYKRGAACATFKDRLSGRKFFFMNTHAALNREDHLKYAHVLVDMEKKYNPKGYPSFFVGDLNARPEHPSHRIFREHWSDSADMLPGRLCTYNAFRTDSTAWDQGRQIDFIYYRNISDPAVYECNQKLYGGLCASDHFPILADFKLK